MIYETDAMKRYLILILLISFIRPGFGQIKYEKESRVKKAEVPEAAIRFVDAMQLSSRIRWYKETGYNKTTYEAKTRYKGEKYSIEFSQDGVIEDVEVEIKPEDIHSDTYAEIVKHLSSEHDKYSIEKVQIQYSGNPDLIPSFFRTGENKNGIVIHFEIVISARADGSYTMFEYLFRETGEFVQKSRITLKTTDNLEY